jgi:molybdate transport system substrate-binding protein
MTAFRATALLIAIFLSAMMAASPDGAAELNIVAAGAVRGIIASMIEDYSRQSGLTFNLIVGPTGQLRGAIASGKPTDLVIVSAPLMAEMENSGRIAPGSRIDLGRVGLGVVVREERPPRHLDARSREGGADQGEHDRLHGPDLAAHRSNN